LDIIKAGHVSVNGQTVTEPSVFIDQSKDNVSVDGRSVGVKSYEYVLLNKPRGCVTTRKDKFAGKTVFDILPRRFAHLVPAGRLDKDTEGLLLLTNDGSLVFTLTHPKFDVDKTYWVKAAGRLSEDEKKKLERGVVIEGKITAPARITRLRHVDRQTEFEITIHEGRKRQIRVMLEHVGHRVAGLKRLRQGPLSLGDLQPGQWRTLNDKEINQLKKPRLQIK
jgi:pseudouridine synthase